MIIKKQCIAMILAGGQGSRLHALTKGQAKPAVPFGGKYRIIDFPLSNCVNSGIDTVGVLTQYQPFELNEYIGNGQPWDLDRLHGGVFILPPYQKSSGSAWYSGTANAVYQNLSFMSKFDPEYVIVLGGDHIYKMNYAKMLSHHVKTKADGTIAVINVPIEEAPRFGIMNADEDGKVYEFEEKPQNPKSDLASMGIYIFSTGILKKYLEEDEANPESQNDFGNDIIPKMLSDGMNLQAYNFKGYWKDVGTIASLWEANMDLLGEDSTFNLWRSNWKIYYRTPGLPPQYVGEHAEIKNSIVGEGAEIYGSVDHSIIFQGVTIGEHAEVKDSIIMQGTTIGPYAKIKGAIIAEGCKILSSAEIGEEVTNTLNPEIAVIAPEITIGERVKVKKNEMINNDILGGE